MPQRQFPLDIPCPAPCTGTCHFEVTVSWDEVEEGGRIYASNLVFEMLPEEVQPAGTPTDCRPEFGSGSGQFEFTPRGGAAVDVDGSNVWDQQRHAKDPTTGSPTGPGGSDVEYRDQDNNPVPDKTSGEPYKISYTAGLLESFHIHVVHNCLCICQSESGGAPTTTEQLRADVDFTSRESSKDGGKCFIASTVYGESSPQVLLLREFRDERLVTHSLGRLCVRLYYVFSPSVAIILSRSWPLRSMTRWVLDKGTWLLIRKTRD